MDEQLYIVRFWDGFDGEWTDASDPLPKDQAEELCGDKNEARTSGPGAGERQGSYDQIDYYRVFPADSEMVFTEGNSQIKGGQVSHLARARFQ